jgi:hypothetical protein
LQGATPACWRSLINLFNMDSCESDKRKNQQEEPETGDPEPLEFSILQSFWVRLCNSLGIEYNKFILDYNRYYVLACGSILWSVYILV